MVSTNDKKVRQAMKNHVLSFYKGEGGLTAFIKDVNYCRHMSYGDRDMGVSYAMDKLLNYPKFLFRNYEIEAFLHRLGFKDDARLEKYRNPSKYGFGDGPAGLYSVMVIRAGNEIYDEYMKKHAPKRK